MSNTENQSATRANLLGYKAKFDSLYSALACCFGECRKLEADLPKLQKLSAEGKGVMLCDICKQGVASVHFTQIVTGQVKTLDACETCSEIQGVDDPTSDEGKKAWKSSNDKPKTGNALVEIERRGKLITEQKDRHSDKWNAMSELLGGFMEVYHPVVDPFLQELLEEITATLAPYSRTMDAAIHLAKRSDLYREAQLRCCHQTFGHSSELMKEAETVKGLMERALAGENPFSFRFDHSPLPEVSQGIKAA